MFSALTHDSLLFFTNLGRVYQVKVWELQEGTRISKGQAVVNLINITAGERITSILTYNPASKSAATYVVMATKKGTVKKTEIAQYEKIRRNGLVAIKLNSGDELSWVKLCGDSDHVLLVTHEGKCIRFESREVRATARDTMGVRGITIRGHDFLVSMDIISKSNNTAHFLTIMEKGLGKQTPIAEFPLQRRSGQGVKVANVTTKTGKVVVSQIIPVECDTVVLTSRKGQVVKLPITSVPVLSRSTQGVILMRFTQNADSIAAATCLAERESRRAYLEKKAEIHENT